MGFKHKLENPPSGPKYFIVDCEGDSYVLKEPEKLDDVIENLKLTEADVKRFALLWSGTYKVDVKEMWVHTIIAIESVLKVNPGDAPDEPTKTAVKQEMQGGEVFETRIPYVDRKYTRKDICEMACSPQTRELFLTLSKAASKVLKLEADPGEMVESLILGNSEGSSEPQTGATRPSTSTNSAAKRQASPILS